MSTILLDKIYTPDDLKQISAQQLPLLCEELREFVIEQLSHNPGHLGSSLGALELCVALHYVYDSPNDNIVFDVGHQAYVHKILTGRREQFHTNRKKGGICGFPKRSESEYDTFGGGHASVSISAALGMDVAAKLEGDKRFNIAVIGDGAMSGGLAFEGLNNAGVLADNLLVILNDNKISIDPNVGALKEYLVDITTSHRYNLFKQNTTKLLSSTPVLYRFAAKMLFAVKTYLLQQSNIFEGLNFRYFGIADGHDVQSLVRVLSDIKTLKGPKILHIRTKKGKGYSPAEKSQTTWHAPGIYDVETGKRHSGHGGSVRYQDVFGETLLELAKENSHIVGITPAMPTGCSMNIMSKVFPDRVFDVGIAEGHAVTFSAGLAVGGMIPFCNIYSSFAQRAYDNVIHDAVLQGIDLVLCLDRSGIVGEDGATHHGTFDIPSLRTIPQITIAAPMNESELRNMMYTAQLGGKGTVVIRYPRGNGVLGENWRTPMEEIEIGKGRKLTTGTDIALLSFGHPGNNAAEAVIRASEAGISVMHCDMRFVKPLDEALLDEIASSFDKIITVEDGSKAGGAGSAVLEYLSDKGYRGQIIRLGIGDHFVDHGTVSELIAECGYDSDGIFNTITALSSIDSSGEA